MKKIKWSESSKFELVGKYNNNNNSNYYYYYYSQLPFVLLTERKSKEAVKWNEIKEDKMVGTRDKHGEYDTHDV